MAKIIYKVREGDYLQKIAAEQLGDPERWPEIAYINSLEQPYLIRTNDILLLPNDNEVLEVVITKGIEKPAMNTAATASAFQFTPATVALFAVAAVVLFFWDSK